MVDVIEFGKLLVNEIFVDLSKVLIIKDLDFFQARKGSNKNDSMIFLLNEK